MDILKAYICISLSKEVYLNPDDRHISGEESFSDKGSGTEGFSLVDGDTQYISFRGTEKRYKDWKTDFSFWKTRRHYGRVHKGFCDAYESIRPLLIPPPCKKVVFTGHSLGGAIAQIAALEWSVFYPNAEIEVYTFGAPKIFAYKAHKRYNEKVKKSFHFVLNNDIIPRIPTINYWGTSSLYYINKDGEIVTNSKRSYRIKDGLRDFKIDGKVEFFSDHNQEDYYRYIKDNLNEQEIKRAAKK
tara:strand:- start:404 stop:1132 length:729 start_codon:yes stop_codon:yes gene_type:complete